MKRKFFKKIAAVLTAAAMMIPYSTAGIDAAAYEGLYGDLDGNGTVDTDDFELLMSFILKRSTLTDEQGALADMNRDGRINVFDMLMLKRKLSSAMLTNVSRPFIEPSLGGTLASLPSQGSARLAVFYVDFPDCRYTTQPSEEEIERIVFGKENSSDENYPFESIAAFFERSSKGAVELSGEVFKYTARENKDAYSTDKKKLLEECSEAVGADLSRFDGNNDGVIDAVLISVPEAANTYTESSPGSWWPCAGAFDFKETEIDGAFLGQVVTGCAQIKSSADCKDFVSSYCHELSHCMGLPDYYLYYTPSDQEGFHGDLNTAGTELMDSDASTDLCCFSKLMLGWYREDQVSVYDAEKGGEQTFVLSCAQGSSGGCLILPRGDTDYNGEYMILEYITPEGNNKRPKYYWQRVGSGIRGYHVKADIADNGFWKYLKYENGSAETNFDDDGIRLIRLINDAEGGGVFTSGSTIDGNISGFHWYADDESESVDTGYEISIGSVNDRKYTVTVNKRS